MNFRVPFLTCRPVLHSPASFPSARRPMGNHHFLRGVFCAALTMQMLTGCAGSMPSENQPVQWELTPEAQLTYATLLLDQAIRDDDREGILTATETLLRLGNNPQPFVDAAAWLILHKNTAEARTLLEKAVLKAPDELSLHLLLSEAWLEQNDKTRAIEIMQTFSANHPDSLIARQELGILYVKTQRYAEAEHLLAALPASMQTAFVLFARSEALQGLNRTTQAIALLRQAVAESPDFIDAWFTLARLLEQQKNYKESSEIYASLIEQDPENEEIWIRLVEGEILARRTEKALEYAQKGPDTFGFRLTAATLFLDAKLFREAETLLLAIKDLPGAPAEVNFYLAAIAFEYHRDPARTLMLLEGIPENNRYFDRALRLRIQLLYDGSNRSDALPLILKGEELYPAERDFPLMEAHLMLAEGLEGDALHVVDRALTQWPEDVDFMYLRGNILDSLGRKKEAFANMEALLVSHPDTAVAMNYIGYSLAEEGRDLDRSLALLRKAVALEPDRAFILDSLAWCLYKKGELNEAWKLITKVVRMPDGSDAAIWEHYGDIAKACGDLHEARKGWTKALENGPESPERLHKKLEER